MQAALQSPASLWIFAQFNFSLTLPYQAGYRVRSPAGPSLLGVLTLFALAPPSGLARQQPAGVWRHRDSVRREQRQRRPCL